MFVLVRVTVNTPLVRVSPVWITRNWYSCQCECGLRDCWRSMSVIYLLICQQVDVADDQSFTDREWMEGWVDEARCVPHSSIRCLNVCREHERFVQLSLRLLSIHLSMALARGVTSAAVAVVGSQAGPLRNLLFRLMDMNMPHNIQQVLAQNTICPCSSFVIPHCCYY